MIRISLTAAAIASIIARIRKMAATKPVIRAARPELWDYYAMYYLS